MIKPLTSLRFLFALMVFASHLSLIIHPKQDSLLYWMNQQLFSEGFIGVSFFFILSGFILSYNYQEKITNKIVSKYDFWIARIARIYPLHLLTMLMMIPLLLTEQIQLGIFFLVKTILNLTLLQSFIPNAAIYFSFNSPSWSISNEFFFYILFPFLILLIAKNKNLAWILFFLSIMLIPLTMHLFNADYQHHLYYIHPVFRLVDFSIGIFLFGIYKKMSVLFYIKNYWYTLLEVTAVLIFCIFFLFHNHIPLVYRYSCYYWIPMSFIILCFSFQKGMISGFLSHNLMILLGEISFGIYLIHSIIINYFYAINFKFLHLSNDYLIIFIVFTITLFVSYILFIKYEKPANKYIKNSTALKQLFTKK